ncbi:MAG: hypothetical protein COW67_08675 [Flavobacteriales bacterium CG18_big_fil_WC_8_21_14_2_50_32_9]|nr:glycosyltransferase [Flavobacteriales bacterium]PIQ15377.1 MAG: hypothetical protein COW67_08675 [Flavobacteriales bacterium CG18_big_fil_WC_8_21_14_2_50_32_9]PJC62780.1 MAG: hypothetical protein CO022_02730 [Flavobacteriales bacterium CG_4_9_14_0_2_um_filter_32_27]
MKIAIVCGHFIPSMGYLEVHLANAFHKLNHKVKVITTNVIPAYVKNISNLSESTPYEIIRLTPSFSMGQMIKAKGLVEAVQKFDPQLVICIGVGKLFPKPIYKLKDRDFRLITLLGDNEETYTAKGYTKKLKNSLIQQFVKKTVYLQAIKKSDVLFPYTPSTIDIICRFVNAKYAEMLKSKSHQISLGFDDEHFFYNALERNEQRKQLGISAHETLLITATRVVPEKGLEKIIDLVDIVNKKGLHINYLIVGFQEDEYSKNLKEYIAQKEHKNRIICKPFSATSQTRKYYNAADTAIFSRAAISIFEALATGLFLLLPQQKNMSHILTKENGVYFDSLTEDVIIECINHQKENRVFRVNAAKMFSYTNLAHQILKLSEV